MADRSRSDTIEFIDDLLFQPNYSPISDEVDTTHPRSPPAYSTTDSPPTYSEIFGETDDGDQSERDSFLRDFDPDLLRSELSGSETDTDVLVEREEVAEADFDSPAPSSRCTTPARYSPGPAVGGTPARYEPGEDLIADLGISDDDTLPSVTGDNERGDADLFDADRAAVFGVNNGTWQLRLGYRRVWKRQQLWLGCALCFKSFRTRYRLRRHFARTHVVFDSARDVDNPECPDCTSCMRCAPSRF